MFRASHSNKNEPPSRSFHLSRSPGLKCIVPFPNPGFNCSISSSCKPFWDFSAARQQRSRKLGREAESRRAYTREAATRPNSTRHLRGNASFFRALDRNVPNPLSGFAFQLAFHSYKRGRTGYFWRIEPSEPTFGSNFAKELPVQEVETEIQPNSSVALHLNRFFRTFGAGWATRHDASRCTQVV
jgi:hypothetical protein